jgi:hypothetical protein
MKFPWRKERPKELPPEARFEEEFGVSPMVATPEQVVERILSRYNQLKHLQTSGYYAENHPGNEYGYLRDWGVRNWKEFTFLKTQFGQILKAATDAAQPYIVEDLSFISVLGVNPNMLDDSSLLVQPGRNAVTMEQAEIIRGKITLKK